MRTPTNKLLSMLMAIMIIISSAIPNFAYAYEGEQELEDGVYEVDVYGWHETQDKASMMANCLDRKAVLEIADGEITATIKFVPTSIMGLPVTGADIAEVWPEPAGTLTTGTGITGTVNEEESSNTFTFELSTLELPKLSMAVAPMNNAIMTIRLNFDMETLTEITEQEPEPIQLEDGKYEIDVYGWHETQDKASMMANCLDRKAVLEIADGEITATIKFVPTSIMGLPVTGADIAEVWPEPAGTLTAGTGITGTVNEEEDSNTFTFELSTLDLPKLSMAVAPMNNAIMSIRLNFDMETLTEITEPEPTYEVKVVAGANGTVNTAGGTYEAGEEIEITATPTEGYKFKDWTVTGLGTVADPASASTIFIVGAGEGTVTANFEEEAIAPVFPSEDGIYEIGVKGWHSTLDDFSPMKDALDPKATLKIENGKMTVTIKFIPANIFGFEIDGSEVEEVWPEPSVGEVLVKGEGLKGVFNEADGSQSFTFELSTLELPRLGAFVTTMGSAPVLRLNFDKGDWERIGDLPTDEPKEDEPNLEEPEELPSEIVQPSEKDNVVILDKETLKTWIDNKTEEEKGTLAVAIPVQKGTEGSVDGIIVIPVSVLQSHIGDGVNSLQVLIEKISSEDEAGAEEALPENTTILQDFDVKLIKVFDADTEEVHDLNGKVKVVIELTDAQAAEISEGTPGLYYYNPSANELENMNADFEGNTVTFYTEHFSAYVVAVTKTDDSDNGGNDGGGTVTDPELDPDNLADGRYTIKAEALKENDNSKSMAHGLIVQPLQLDVDGGQIWVSMLLKSTGEYPLEEVKMLLYRDKSGNYKKADLTYNSSSQTIVLEFPTNSLTEEQYMQVDVPIVTDAIGKQTFRLIFDTDTLKKGGSMKDPSSVSSVTINEFIIKASAGDGGTITPSGDVKVTKGEDQEFLIKANEGYKIKYVIVDGKSVGAVETYTFNDVQKGATISVSFEKTDGVNLAEFTDIVGHWAENVIKIVVEKGLLVGTGDNKFSPDMEVTRGMLVTVLGRLANVDVSSYESLKFADVDFAQYYAKSIAWAAEAGIVAGVSDDKFAPDTSITREQLAVIIMNYAKFAGIDLTETDEKTEFSDMDEISSWAKSSVLDAQKSGLINGKENNKFDPKRTATRAEAAAIIVRLLDIAEAQQD